MTYVRCTCFEVYVFKVKWTDSRFCKEAVGAGEHPVDESRRRSDARQSDSKGGGPAKLLSPTKRRRAAKEIQETLHVSERPVCSVLGQARSTHRAVSECLVEEDRLRASLTSLACQYGRYGYRRITTMRKLDGLIVHLA